MSGFGGGADDHMSPLEKLINLLYSFCVCSLECETPMADSLEVECVTCTSLIHLKGHFPGCISAFISLPVSDKNLDWS